MKNMKRLLTVCMLVAVLGTMLFAFTACFGGGVEGAFDDIIAAESYTKITTSASGEVTTLKVDMDAKYIYRCRTSTDGTKKEMYIWQDAEAGKYYSAEVNSKGAIEKEELTKGEFIESFASYADSNADALQYKAAFSLMTENGDGSYSYVYKGTASTRTTTGKLDDEGNLVVTVKTEYLNSSELAQTSTTKFTAIDDTVIEIPQKVISAICE